MSEAFGAIVVVTQRRSVFGLLCHRPAANACKTYPGGRRVACNGAGRRAGLFCSGIVMLREVSFGVRRSMPVRAGELG
jgi:hypothetical protein